jgi:hypothetical protein
MGITKAANPIVLILTGAQRGRNRLLVATAAAGWLLAWDPDGSSGCMETYPSMP